MFICELVWYSNRYSVYQGVCFIVLELAQLGQAPLSICFLVIGIKGFTGGCVPVALRTTSLFRFRLLCST